MGNPGRPLIGLPAQHVLQAHVGTSAIQPLAPSTPLDYHDDHGDHGWTATRRVGATPFNFSSRRAAKRFMTMEAWDDPPPAREIVEAWLDRVRPALVADGGNIELVSIEHDGTVKVSLQGACADCPAQLATLRVGIEEPIKQAIRGIRSVVAVN